MGKRSLNWELIAWAIGGFVIGGAAVWIYKDMQPTQLPAGTWVTSTGQVVTPAQQASILTPVALS